MDFKMKDVALRAGDKLMIRGKIPHDAKRFVIDLGCDPQNLALRFNPRFQCDPCNPGSALIVCNSKDAGSWGKAIKETKTCFKRGCDDVKIIVKFSCDEFEVTVPNKHTVRFPNRLAVEVVTFVVIRGDFTLKCLRIMQDDALPKPPAETTPERGAGPEDDEGGEGPQGAYCIIHLERDKPAN